MATDVHHIVKLTSAEVGSLHLAYLANSMSVAMLTYLENTTGDPDIKALLGKSLKLSQSLVEEGAAFFRGANIPVPQGFIAEDVVPDAPKLFSDIFHLNYLSMMGNYAPVFYAIALPGIARLDVQKFFINSLHASVELHNETDILLLEKGLYVRPPYIPNPTQVEFVHNQKYLTKKRPLNALEIANLHGNLQLCEIKMGLLEAFRQVSGLKDLKKYFDRGYQYNVKQVTVMADVLRADHVTFTSSAGQDITASTTPPFSEKLMLFHIAQLSSAKARSFGDAIAVSARHDLGIMYMRLMTETGLFAEDGVNLLIEHGWFEQIPQAANRDELAKQNK